MLVAMYYNNKDVRLQEMPKPAIGDDEFLFKIMASGICGSDVTEWYRVPKAPKVLGHEAAGIIAEIGKNVKGHKVGDRVFVSHHVPCNKCRYCLRGHHTACETLHTTNYFPGGFAQYVRVPKINVENGVYNLPDSMSFEEGTFIEPLACVVRRTKTIRTKEKRFTANYRRRISRHTSHPISKNEGCSKYHCFRHQPVQAKASREIWSPPHA